ncbi:geranylgeranyl pyrophosphate synthetase [Fusarium torreyae]|uniref:Geranylgeranyl pyrophosphate synthetase n=1 Tax=Fusarium torreyae TaxID=1237075 RepID=A0A9W8RN21_9HYPO|nr:geranylgeranyl pyrophosphate synthetase [Fusarium torreyae]
MLHNSSLILDDFQDNSPLRRVKAILQIQEFSGHECTADALQMIMSLFEGQAMDLYWSFNAICPSIDEYTQMINDKTGGLFGLTRHLLVASSERSLDDNTLASLNKMVTLWGQYFQIRDDYMNLVDTKYSEMKGFCEDLDEGKYSLALIHAIENNQDGYLLQNLISTRRTLGKLTQQQKMLVLDIVRSSGGFERTETALNELHRQIVTEVGSLEVTLCQTNAEMRALTDLLSI